MLKWSCVTHVPGLYTEPGEEDHPVVARPPLAGLEGETGGGVL